MGIIKIKNKNKKHESEETLTPNELALEIGRAHV